MYALCVLPVDFRSLLHWVFAAQFFHSLEIASNQSIFTTFQREVIHRVARNVLKKYFFYMFCCAVFMYATCAWYFSNSPIRAHAKWKPCEGRFVLCTLENVVSIFRCCSLKRDENRGFRIRFHIEVHVAGIPTYTVHISATRMPSSICTPHPNIAVSILVMYDSTTSGMVVLQTTRD